MLRFWWRALAYATAKGDLSTLHAQESALFGGSKAQAQLRISIGAVSVGGVHAARVCHPELRHRSGACYLGYGLVKAIGRFRGELERGCIDRASFELKCIQRDPFPPDLIRSLKLMGMLGCLGSRARKGYGSLTLSSLVGGHESEDLFWQAPSDKASYISEIASLLIGTATHEALPKISAFTGQTRIEFVNEGDDPIGLLDHYGKAMQLYRSWGFDSGNGHNVSGEPAEQRFPGDHHWSKGRPPSPTFHPERAMFGMPHSYNVRGSRSKTVTPLKRDGIQVERRASPLFYHVHDFGNGRYAGICTILKSEMLPRGAQIDADGKPVPLKQDFGVLHEFLDAKRLDNGKPYFDLVPIWGGRSGE